MSALASGKSKKLKICFLIDVKFDKLESEVLPAIENHHYLQLLPYKMRSEKGYPEYKVLPTVQQQ